MANDSSQPEKPKLPSDDDIQARFARIREDLKNMELPELPEDEALREKIQKVTQGTAPSRMPDVPELNFNRPKNNPLSGSPSSYNYRGLGIGMSAAYSLIGSMIVGFGLGWLFDKATHNNYGIVIGSLAGSVLGIVASIWMINQEGPKK